MHNFMPPLTGATSAHIASVVPKKGATVSDGALKLHLPL